MRALPSLHDPDLHDSSSQSAPAAAPPAVAASDKDRATGNDSASSTAAFWPSRRAAMALHDATMKRTTRDLDDATDLCECKKQCVRTSEPVDSDIDATSDASAHVERTPDSATAVIARAAETTPTATTAASMFFATACRASTATPATSLATAQRVLSPLAVASAEQIQQHLRDVRREVFLRPLLPIITRLMFHKYNHGLFNVRVDPVAWNIPHYVDIVKQPMDLSLVKSKCLNLEYATAADCAADIRLVFANACLFNPPGHAVHEAAKLLLAEFETEYKRYAAKATAAALKRDEHACTSCLANVCGICNQKCINFEPPFVVCAGPCRQRIKRHALYYATRERTHHWCAKCYTSLPKLLTLRVSVTAPDSAVAVCEPAGSEQVVAKTSLVKAKFLDELTEPWVQCDECNGWVHQICALFNATEDDASDNDDDVPFVCPLCRVDALARAEQDWDIEMSPSADERFLLHHPTQQQQQHKLDLMGSHSPVLKRKPSAKEFTRVLGFDAVIEEKVFDFLGCRSSVVSPSNNVAIEFEGNANDSAPAECARAGRLQGFVTSEQLWSCALSRFMQTWVREHLVQLGERDAAQSIVVKVVSSIKTTCPVSPAVREHFCSSSQSYPSNIDFTSKAIFVFQKIDGVEVCIFSMYVQEYDASASVAANRNRTYIAYIDSLVYMRPRHVRTSLFHATLIAYLAGCKARGFERAHIWACPTTRGGDFIYWCHPSFQKNPGKDRLLQWYLAMADVGKRANVVFACDDLYASAFENLETRLATTELPPYFDGDFWPAEVERLAAHPPKRGRLSKDAYAASLCGANFRKRIVDAVKLSRESLFVIALQPTCSACSAMIVNSVCWKRERDDGSDKYMCTACYEGSSAAQNENEDPAAVSMVRVDPPSFVETLASSVNNNNSSSSSSSKAEPEVKCAFLDHRPDMLKHCEEQHYQFDSYRRAKYSTMMLIYQIASAQQQQQGLA